MTVNYFIKCPVCGSITRMRSPAGYLYSTPVRVHCGKCKTLLSGVFISDNQKVKAYYKPINCSEVCSDTYDYYGEASGELLCNKIIEMKGNIQINPIPKLSPVFSFFDAMSIESCSSFINYACYISSLSDNWDTEKIKYDLFLHQEYDFIKRKYYPIAEKYGYILNCDSDIVRFIYFSLFYDCGGIFKSNYLENMLIDINYHIYHLDASALKKYIDELTQNGRLKDIQNNLFSIFFSYVGIVKHLIPAIGASYYDMPQNIDKASEGLTTCTFTDISSFYQNTFETLADCCEIVAGLDNIENRYNYDSFSNSLNMTKFNSQKKGNRIKFLPSTEFFSKTFNMDPLSNELRNAIGHNKFKYDGISQEVRYTPDPSNQEEKCIFLLDVALACVSFMKSTLILLFYVYELQRFKLMYGGIAMPLHPMLYKRANSQNHCPCGSGKKYRDCCREYVKEQKKKVKNKGYPQEADISFRQR